MNTNIREFLNFSLLKFKGLDNREYYYQFLKEENSIPPDTTKKLLSKILLHCKNNVPYYREMMINLEEGITDDSEAYLSMMPILTKKIIRKEFDRLKSGDLISRKWYDNTTGGSTGEPVSFIQDYEFSKKADAIKLLFSKLIGYEIGKHQVFFWGDLHDIKGGSEGWKARLLNQINNRHFVSIFNLEPDRLRSFITLINQHKPELIVGYVWILYEIARFVERENLHVEKQKRIISTAGTLYPLIRQTIEKVFQTRVYNRYGTREVGDVACERPGIEGLWVAPWGNYIEIVDENGKRVPDGVEGRILITSLINYAMPLIRYDIGDIGSIAPNSNGKSYQVLQSVTGRTIDLFINKNGKTVEAAHFMPLLYNKDWIDRYQVIQKSPAQVLFKIIPCCDLPPVEELDEIKQISKRIMDDQELEVEFDFVEEIKNDPSGKFRYIKSDFYSENNLTDDNHVGIGKIGGV